MSSQRQTLMRLSQPRLGLTYTPNSLSGDVPAAVYHVRRREPLRHVPEPQFHDQRHTSRDGPADRLR